MLCASVVKYFFVLKIFFSAYKIPFHGLGIQITNTYTYLLALTIISDFLAIIVCYDYQLVTNFIGNRNI